MGTVLHRTSGIQHHCLQSIHRNADTAVSGSFFVGYGITLASGGSFASFDDTNSQENSWIYFGSLSDVTPATHIEGEGSGNFLIRANLEAVPEASSANGPSGNAGFVGRSPSPLLNRFHSNKSPGWGGAPWRASSAGHFEASRFVSAGCFIREIAAQPQTDHFPRFSPLLSADFHLEFEIDDLPGAPPLQGHESRVLLAMM